MTNSRQPDLGVRVLVPQVIRGDDGILAERIASALGVNGDYLSLVVFLNKVADVPLVNLFSEAGCFLARSARVCD